MTPEEFKHFLSTQVMLLDGAMGTMIQSFQFEAGVYGGEAFQMLSDMIVFSRPAELRELHLQYYRAGSHAVETNTFGASPLRLQEFDFTSLDLHEFPEQPEGLDLQRNSVEVFAYHLNKRAAEIAREALEIHQKDTDYDQRPLFVIGSLGPSNWVLSSTHADLRQGTYDQIEENFYCQALGLIDGGVDLLIFDTQQDILELKVAIIGSKRAMTERGVDLPIIAQVTVDKFSRMQIFNTDIHAVITTLQDIGIHALGINCSLGPEQMTATIEKMSRYSRLPISVVPNAGLPESENGQTIFRLTPDNLAHHLSRFITTYGVNIVGGCCGTTPEHIRVVRDAIRGLTPAPRTIDKRLYVSGPQQAVLLDGETSLIRIGERLNVRGSAKVRLAVEESKPIDHDALEEVVNEQVRDLGLEIIDVCMDSNVVETKETLVAVVRHQTMDFPGAMCLDSFDVEALAEAVRNYPGRPVINSISMEEYAPGVDKVDAVLSVTRQHAPVYIALTTGPGGPAVTAAQKIELSRKILDKAVQQHGIKPEQLIFDINAFPIGAEPEPGLNFALESINAIPEIKKLHRDIKTIIGVGNLTNGLGKKPYMRKVLTSVFLDEARKKGLDAAIVNPNHYVPVDSLNSRDYELGRRIILEHDMDAFFELEEIALQKKQGGSEVKKSSYESLDLPAAVCAKIKDGFKERAQGHVSVRNLEYPYSDRIVVDVAAIIQDMEPLSLINDHLMPAMEELGAGFADGMVSLPHLLKSADVMKQVMGFLEAYMKSSLTGENDLQIRTKGTIVLGTVYQDVHSIGKDLAKTLMENYGYKVIDLGVQVPITRFVEAAEEHQAMAIGMSALLVQTSNHMIAVSTLLKERQMDDIPILIGGAPVNNRHAAYVAMAGMNSLAEIRDNVFYCRSGMDGVNILNQLLEPTQTDQLLAENRKTLTAAYQSGQNLDKQMEELFNTLPTRTVPFESSRSPVVTFEPVHKRVYRLSDFKDRINQKLLFSLNWKYGGQRSWERKGVTPEMLAAKLDEWIERADDNDWIKPQGVYALFPCRGGDRTVTVLDPESRKTLATLTFNDVIGKGKKDIFNVARFFNPDQDDVIGIQLTTAGSDVDRAIQSFSEEDREGSLLLQGLSNRIAEDMADHVNQILNDMVFRKQPGSSMRYSPGYPSMSNIENNRPLFEILNAGQRLGIELTDGFEFYPTGTTAAIVCFHPEAAYN
ncbi:MAG: homocysteine S-methyltransferase family protein [bacterium]